MLVEKQIKDLLVHHEQVKSLIADPEVVSDLERYKELAREFKRCEPIVTLWGELVGCRSEVEEAQNLLSDPELEEEMREWAEQQLAETSRSVESLEIRLQSLLLPKDPLDEKNIIVELRAGAGGDEAGLFVADLSRMYSKFSESQGWKVETLSSHETGVGGFKEIILSIQGELVYSKMKFESGVHRVQRVPTTESSGRIHTSTITVAVLPEVEEIDFEIHQQDVRVDTFCASGPGGQSVNTTYSAVRLTHVPTGTTVSCQDEKSQIKNKDKAFKVLRARLAAEDRKRREAELAANRSSQVGTGERSEKIRTYNSPQGRVSDHRIGLTLHSLQAVLEGELQDVIEALTLDEERRKLEALQAG